MSQVEFHCTGSRIPVAGLNSIKDTLVVAQDSLCLAGDFPGILKGGPGQDMQAGDKLL